MARSLRFLLFFLGILFIGYVGLHFWVKSKVETQLRSKLPHSWAVTYKDLSLSLIKGSLELINLSLYLRDSLSNTSYLDIESEKLGFYELSYNDLLKDNALNIAHARLVNPRINYKPFAHKKDSLDTSNKTQKSLAIEHFELENGVFELYPSTLDTLGLSLSRFDMELTDLQSKEKDSLAFFPFDYGTFQLEVDSLKAPLGEYEEVLVSKLRMDNDSIQMTEVHLNTLLDPNEFSRVFKVERDHYKLNVASIQLPLPELEKKEGRVIVGLSHMHIQEPHFQVYRDKLLPDEFSTKTLFNEKFRNLPFTLSLDSLKIDDAAIKYIERDKNYNDGGYIEFSDMDILALSLGNGYPADTLSRIVGQGQFMQKASLEFQWEFDTQAINDHFLFTAEVEDLPASEINKLTGNNLDVLFDGKINSCTFSINGNKYKSHYDFNIQYRDLSVEILNRKKGKTHWLGTKLANLLLRKSSKTKEGNTRHHRGEVTRIPYKSFFNFLWINVQDGLIHTVI